MAARIRSTILSVDVDEASRDDAVIGSVVSLVSLDAATTYSWSIVFAPKGSSAAFTGDPSAISPGTFTCDLEGAYLIRLVTDATLPTEDTQYVRIRVPTVFGGLSLIAAGERRDDTGTIPVDVDTEGWANEQNANFQTLLSLIKPLVSSGRVLYVDANDGTSNYADYTTIQAAIDAAVASTPTTTSQWVVLVRPGQYTENLTFAEFVHVIGWPGNPDGNTSKAVVLEGTHSATWSSGETLLANLHLENNTGTTTPTLTKSGVGTLRLFGCRVESNGSDANQGAALEVSGGILEATRSFFLHNTSNGSTRRAIYQSAGSTLQLDNCEVIGPSGLLVNNDSIPTTGVSCIVSHSKVSGVHASGFGIGGVPEDLKVEFTTVSGGAESININPSALAFTGPVALTIHFSDMDGGDIRYDTTGLTGTTDLKLGSVIYNNLVFPAGTPTQTATTQAKTSFYDNATSGLVATNVQDAIDEVASTPLTLSTTTTISPTQIRNLHTTPITIVPAPGVGRVLVPLSFVLFLDFGTTAHVDGGDLEFRYVGSTGRIGIIEGNTLINATADAIRQTGVGQNPGTPQTIETLANAGIEIRNDGVAYTGTGDSPLVVKVFYLDVASPL